MFTPANPSNNDSLNAIYAVFKSNPRPHRDAGMYGLIDNSTTNPYKTLQYYIYDKNFVQKNNNGSTQKFWQHPDVPILDGYTVVIRQVSILTGPIAQGFAENIIA